MPLRLRLDSSRNCFRLLSEAPETDDDNDDDDDRARESESVLRLRRLQLRLWLRLRVASFRSHNVSHAVFFSPTD